MKLTINFHHSLFLFTNCVIIIEIFHLVFNSTVFQLIAFEMEKIFFLTHCVNRNARKVTYLHFRLFFSSCSVSWHNRKQANEFSFTIWNSNWNILTLFHLLFGFGLSKAYHPSHWKSRKKGRKNFAATQRKQTFFFARELSTFQYILP